MYVLDTDHLSILERGGKVAQPLLKRLAQLQANEVAVTIITYEEQTRGWLSYLAKARSLNAQVQAYNQLKRHLETYRIIPILDFDEQAASEFQSLRKQYPRLGAMVKIAAITIVNDAVLLTRNITDFEQLGLRIEDWTL